MMLVFNIQPTSMVISRRLAVFRGKNFITGHYKQNLQTIFSCLPWLKAPLASTLLYDSVTLNLAGGPKVSTKQNLLALFYRRHFNSSG